MQTPCPPVSPGAYVRRRCLGWVALAAAVTALVVQHSFAAGRLAADPVYDDVVYLNDGLQRLEVAYAGGLPALARDYAADPPHSPWSALLAAASFALFGVHEWAPYAGNGLLLLLAVAFVDGLLRDLPAGARALGLALLCTTPLALKGVAEFRPDIACGMFTAAGVVAVLRPGFGRCGRLRVAAAGVLFGLALFAKPVAFPFTLVMFASALLLAGACDAVLRTEGASVLGWLGRGCGCVGVAALVALPHFAVAWRHVVHYIHMVLFSEHSAEMTLGRGRTFPLWFHLTGDGGRMMLGWHLYLFAAAAAAGVAVLAWRRRPAALASLAAVALAAVPAFLIPTRTGVFNPFFAATLQWLVVFGGLEGLRGLFLAARPGPRSWWRPALAWSCAAALALCGAAWVLPYGGFAASRGDPRQQARHEAMLEVLKDIRANSRWPGPASLCVPTSLGGHVNADVLIWLAGKEGFALSRCTPPMSADPEAFDDVLARADFVLACAPTEKGAAPWAEQFAPAGLPAAVLERARAREDLAEVGRYPIPGNVVCHLFKRRTPFGGWGREQGLDAVEGPYPQWRLPLVRWARGPETRLHFDGDAPRRLRATGRAAVEGQSVTVLLDGVEVHRQDVPQRGNGWVDLDVPLPAAAGGHELVLRYAATDGNPARPVAVLYRRLELVKDPTPRPEGGTPR